MRRSRLGRGAPAALLSLSLMAAACADRAEVPRRAARPLPPVSGTLALEGLTAPVRVARDRWGVPHISAGNQADLFFAQGFVQAQDRLFQMDLWRRAVQGRLSEVLGSNFIERDAMTRRIQYTGDREKEWASYAEGTREIAAAFVRGINAWIGISLRSPSEEFALAGGLPERWQAEDVLNRTDAFLSSSSAHDELFRAQLVAAVGAERADALLPLPDGARTRIPQGLQMTDIDPMVSELLRGAGAAPFFSGIAAPLEDGSARSRPDVRWTPFAAPPGIGAGSNAWAIAPRAGDGAPLLAADPHRPLVNPALRYLVHLRAPGWHVAGATAPWLPGVDIGHNEAVAWSFAASPVDTADFFVERLNPSNPLQVREGSRWADLTVVKEPIVVKGRVDPFEAERRYSRNGVVIAIDGERHLAYVLRWSGAEAGGAGELAALAVNRAQTWEEFRAALARWKMPAAQFVYADVHGNVGHQLAAGVPIRRGWNGALPAPGWSGAYGWSGWSPLNALPGALETATRYVLAANGSVARSSRIRDVLESLPAPTVEDMKRLQHDTESWNAGQLVPLLGPVRADRQDVEDARLQLLRWDRRMTADSTAAGLYRRWEAVLRRRLAAAWLPPGLADEYVNRSSHVAVTALVHPSAVWFDGEPAESRDALLLAALTEAVGALPRERSEGVSFVHAFGISPRTRARFNLGPFLMPGDAETVLSISAPAFGPHIGPSFRAVMDAENWDRSVVTNAPGQSEAAASPHFSDLATIWAEHGYVPLAFSEAAVAAQTVSVLTLVPATR
jgi:penicillin amidase